MHPIRMTKKQIQETLHTLHAQLKAAKSASGEIAITYALKIQDKEKATLKITDIAWKKINALVEECDKEIAWHGTVSKEGNTYTIEDIIVFPQTVTGATVTSDETEYSMWLAQQPDEVFNKLRFHGHSHVNMGTSPSGVDTEYQENVIKNLNDFYIFAIFNKKGSNWCTIYDVEDNIVYEDDDIILETPDIPTIMWAKQQISTYVATIKPAAKPKATSYAEEVVNNYYNKNGKKKTKKELEEDYYKQRELEEFMTGYPSYYYGG